MSVPQASLPGSLREIDQHREQLGADVGVRLEPEAVGVEAIFDAQEALAQLRRRTAVRCARRPPSLCKRRGERVADGIAPRAVPRRRTAASCCASRACRSVSSISGGATGSASIARADVGRQDVLEQPIAIGLGAERLASKRRSGSRRRRRRQPRAPPALAARRGLKSEAPAWRAPRAGAGTVRARAAKSLVIQLIIT